MDRFVKKRVGYPFKKFIGDGEEGNVRQTSSIIHLIQLTTGEQKVRFTMWRNITFTTKELTKGKRTLDLFENLNK